MMPAQFGGQILNNWTVPMGFQCAVEKRCISVSSLSAAEGIIKLLEDASKRTPLARVPSYRHLLSHGNITQKKFKYRDLEKRLPGFQLETGMACSLASLFQLSPSASGFEPELFTQLLPSLQIKTALVLAIYIRTGEADHYGVGHQSKATPPVIKSSILNCALSRELQYLKERPSVSSIIWILLTDSSSVKQQITTNYTGQHVRLDDTQSPPRLLPRTVLTTKSRGAHTRTNRNPSTADFAEAVIDWYLLGESDLVITNNPGFSYGATAALRTFRPFYDGTTCSRVA